MFQNLFVALFFIVYSLAPFYVNGQSKKEQIEFLSRQNDSLISVLDRDSRLFKEQIRTCSENVDKLQLAIKNLDSEITILLKERAFLKDQLADLNYQLDSLRLRNDGGILLTASNEEFHMDDCIHEFIHKKLAIQIPYPDEIGNGSVDNVFPLGWNRNDVFAFAIFHESPRGSEGIDIAFYDLKSRTNLEYFSFSFNVEDGPNSTENCEIIGRIAVFIESGFQKHKITPTNQIRQYYFKVASDEILINDKKIALEKRGKSAELYLYDQGGAKTNLYSHELRSEYDEGYETWCNSWLKISGYFYNPLNPNQYVLHLHDVAPCGFENEDQYSSVFVSLPTP